ncbi:MAG: transposase [Chitinophagaceae bacterium]|nr:transposase [Chitinophagaceae bacterium]
MGISDATFYNWKAKYGGMETSDVKRIKKWKRELSQYKKIVAELTFENRAMKGFIEKSYNACRQKRSCVSTNRRSTL